MKDIQIQIEQAFSRKLIRKEIEEFCKEKFSYNEDLLLIMKSLLSERFCLRGVGINALLANMLSNERLEPSKETLDSMFYIVLENTESNLYKVYANNNGELEVVPMPDVGELAEYARLYDKMSKSMFLPPMVVKPVNWTNNYDGGYLLEKNSILNKRFNSHNMKQNLKVINILQSIPYEINEFIANEIPETDIKDQIQKNYERRILDVYQDFDKFYFAWQYDKRGRTYIKGYQLNPNGRDYSKALVQPINRKKLTDEGRFYAYVGLANMMGDDKLVWEERVEIAEKLVIKVLSLITEEYSLEEAIRDIKEESDWDEPYQAARLLHEICLHELGVKDTFDVMVSLDATASGQQLMSIMSGDKKGMLLTNCTDENHRFDAYTVVYDVMCNITKEEGTLDRDEVKYGIMTAFYNSKATPNKLFSGFTRKVFWSVIAQLFPGAWDIMQKVNELFTEVDHHKWVLPDGHTVLINYKKKYVEEVGIDGTTLLHYAHYKKEGNEELWRSLTPNLIHSI